MSLKRLVNDKSLYDDFLEEINHRLSRVHTSMEQASTSEDLFRLQGEAASLRKLLKLREYVNADTL
jgi:hypothetical protein